MTIKRNRFYTMLLGLMLAMLMILGVPASALAAPTKEFIVVLDAGHGGKDHGAIDNGTREKDINLAVALKLGELIKKRLKDTKVVYTRDDDTFVSLQGRADIANKAKGDLFISIHTNSVDAKNKNRRTVAGASVYTQGGHKDEANLSVAQRENSVIELENGYEQKYSGFDPNKVESYIIFEMAAKHNIAQSHKFAKNVQDNLVKVAGRKDRGVHQAGFWVLWATSMPSALVELDFICNPESAKFMSSKAGVDKLAEAIFEAVKEYEKDFRQKQKMMASNPRARSAVNTGSGNGDFARAIHAGVGTSRAAEEESYGDEETYEYFDSSAAYASASDASATKMVAVSRAPEAEQKDMSHANLNATKNQQKARTSYDGRRRRSAAAKNASDARDISVSQIAVKEEFTGEMARVEPDYDDAAEEASDKNLTLTADKNRASDAKQKKAAQKALAKKEAAKKKEARERSFALSDAEKASKEREKKETAKKDEARKRSFASTSGNSAQASQHAGGRKSLKSRTQ